MGFFIMENRMKREEILARIDEIKKVIEQSVANHNSLIGRLQEAEFLLQKMDEFEKNVVDAETV